MILSHEKGGNSGALHESIKHLQQPVCQPNSIWLCAAGSWASQPCQHLLHELSPAVLDSHPALGRSLAVRARLDQQRCFRPPVPHATTRHQSSALPRGYHFSARTYKHPTPSLQQVQSCEKSVWSRTASGVRQAARNFTSRVSIEQSIRVLSNIHTSGGRAAWMMTKSDQSFA